MGELGVVLVHYRAEAAVTGLAARLAGDGFDVAVVDNSGTYEGGGNVVRPGRNVGFGAACNLGAAALPAGVVSLCFHNPDVEVGAAGLHALEAALRAQPRPGVVAPTLDAAGSLRRRGYRYPAATRELVLAARAARTAPAAPPARQGDGAAPGPARRPGRRRRPGRPLTGHRFGSGALLVVDRDAFTAVGGFDPDYFLYAEDLDLWHRLRAAGYGAGFAPGVVAWHARGGGSPLGRPSRELLRWLGVELFSERHDGGGRWRRLRLAHRPWLPRLAPAAPQLVAAVGPLWQAGLPPSAVMAELRPGLESGALLGWAPA